MKMRKMKYLKRGHQSQSRATKKAREIPNNSENGQYTDSSSPGQGRLSPNTTNNNQFRVSQNKQQKQTQKGSRYQQIKATNESKRVRAKVNKKD